MATIARTVTKQVTSLVGAQANGAPLYVGGQLFTWHIEAPVALGRIEVSNDKANWIASVTGQGDGVGQVTTRPLWARPAVAADGAGPRAFWFWFSVAQENG